jgi:hypothetical protein
MKKITKNSFQVHFARGRKLVHVSLGIEGHMIYLVLDEPEEYKGEFQDLNCRTYYYNSLVVSLAAYNKLINYYEKTAKRKRKRPAKVLKSGNLQNVPGY